MEWISVKERLPDSYKTTVLCFICKEDKKPEILTGHLMYNAQLFIVGNTYEWDLGKVTHWMPLPEPPKP